MLCYRDCRSFIPSPSLWASPEPNFIQPTVIHSGIGIGNEESGMGNRESGVGRVIEWLCKSKKIKIEASTMGNVILWWLLCDAHLFNGFNFQFPNCQTCCLSAINQKWQTHKMGKNLSIACYLQFNERIFYTLAGLINSFKFYMLNVCMCVLSVCIKVFVG